jgi:tetratricopeptide (TPR) repeat protein
MDSTPSDSTAKLAEARRRHQGGDLESAARLYREVLDAEPCSIDSMHLLGVIAGQAGRYDEAVELIGKAVSLNPNFPEAYGNLGVVLRRAGRYDEAIDAHRHAIALRPDAPESYLNLGNALRDAGRTDEALAAYAKAIELKADYGEAHNSLGALLSAAGRPGEAVEALRKAVELNPDFAIAHRNLAAALGQLGRLQEALAACQRAIALEPDFGDAYRGAWGLLRRLGRYEEALATARRAAELMPDDPGAQSALGVALHDLDRLEEAIPVWRRVLSLKPDDPPAYSNLGLALRAVGRLEEALAACRRAIELRPRMAEAHNNLAVALYEAGHKDEALAAYEQAVALNPGFATAHHGRGRVLFDLGRHQEALEAYREAIRADPRHADAHVNAAIVLQEIGRTDEARTAVEQALAIDPASARAWRVRSDLKTFQSGDPDLEAMERALAEADARRLSRQHRIDLEFAAGKAWLDAGDAEKAFAHLNTANRQARAEITYDVEADVAGLAKVARRFTRERMESMQGRGDGSDLPVFVVGMPRSGTTLVEQVLASHPEVYGAGEITVLPEVLRAQRRLLDELTGDLAAAGSAYVERVAALAPDKRRVVDKLPGNFRFLGLIFLMLPNARVIHCRRDPVDTCLSCYVRAFSDRLDFAYDQQELGRYYRAYAALMDHWRAVAPADRFLEVRYEDVVDDLEGQARRMVSFLGLTWNEACLDFHKTSRLVRTASVNQVRRPIYRDSVARWKRYERHLGPLLEALQGR